MEKKFYFSGIVLFLIIMLAACVSGPATGSGDSAGDSAMLQHNLQDGAEIVKIDMSFSKIRKESAMESLFMNVSIKNNSAVPKRYVCTVFIPSVGSGQDFAPVSEEKKINPGETDTAKISIMTDSFPSSYQINVQEDK